MGTPCLNSTPLSPEKSPPHNTGCQPCRWATLPLCSPPQAPAESTDHTRLLPVNRCNCHCCKRPLCHHCPAAATEPPLPPEPVTPPRPQKVGRPPASKWSKAPLSLAVWQELTGNGHASSYSWPASPTCRPLVDQWSTFAAPQLAKGGVHSRALQPSQGTPIGVSKY